MIGTGSSGLEELNCFMTNRSPFFGICVNAFVSPDCLLLPLNFYELIFEKTELVLHKQREGYYF